MLKEKLAQLRAALSAKVAERNTVSEELRTLREADSVDAEKVKELRDQRDAHDREIDTLDADVRELEAEIARDAHLDELSKRLSPTGAAVSAVARTEGLEVTTKRTYNKDSDKRGLAFVQDVVRSQIFNNAESTARLADHMAEERAERGEAFEERAIGTGAAAGLVIPQYAVDLVAPSARAGRPLADNANHHDLPEKGMSVNISRVTTGTSSALQASENSSVSETDFDDTLLTVPVLTAAGSQTISRQAAMRGEGIDETVLSDLIGAHNTDLDSQLINTATYGLSAFATAVAYTDGTPTAPEAYPKILGAQAAMIVAMLNQYRNDGIAVMHPRRWLWLQSQMTSSWPFINQGGLPVQVGGIATGENNGGGVTGVLPNGLAVISDANVPTNKGGGTEDEIYVLPKYEAHLWEDPNAPLFIQAEQTQAKKLAIDMVVFSFFAFTFGRYPTAIQKVNGTGLVTPTF